MGWKTEPAIISEHMETAFTLDQTSDGELLSLDELGTFLSQLASEGLIAVTKIIQK